MIGNVLEQIRKIYGYTITQISELLHISPGYISEIENGRKQPPLELLQKYADAYGMRLSALIGLHEAVKEIQKSEKDHIAVRIATTQRISCTLMMERKQKDSAENGLYMNPANANGISPDPVSANPSDLTQEDRKIVPIQHASQKETGKWIPVTECLPDKPGHYWVTIRHATGAMTVEKKPYHPETPSRAWTDGLAEKKTYSPEKQNNNPDSVNWNEIIIAWQPYYCPETYDL